MFRNTRAIVSILIAAATCTVFALIDPCAVVAQAPSAPTGHRQPAEADVANAPSNKKDAALSPADAVMERALNNVCRGCAPTVSVTKVPRYDVAVTCGAAVRSGRDGDTCRRDEEGARNQLNQQWTQFTAAARSNCMQTITIGGRPSYLELFVCLKGKQIA